MGMIEGTTNLKSWTGDYSFAVDGGAVSTIVLRSNDGQIPAGSIILGGVIDVTVSCASATGTMALQVEAAGDILATVGQAGVTAGRKSVIPAFTGVTTVKTTVGRAPSLVIATAAFTAGVFRLRLVYL